jgi:hypothetical protein
MNLDDEPTELDLHPWHLGASAYGYERQRPALTQSSDRQPDVDDPQHEER